MPALSIAATQTFVTPRHSARRSMVLPGRVTWKDARGTTLFPHLPGQTRDPIYNTTLDNE